MRSSPDSALFEQRIQALGNTLQKELNASLSKQVDRLAGEQNRLIRSALDAAMGELSQQLLGASAGSAGSNLGEGGGRLGSAIARLIGATVNDLFDRKRTEIRQNETERSAQADDDFRRSRSQQQASAAAAQQKGLRNL